MRGKWAAGIVPRNFAWIIKGTLAVSERPGGQAPHHRRIRRQEEIIWLGAQGFTRVVSLLPSSHNLYAYEERAMPAAHFALPLHADAREVLEELYPALLGWLKSGERVLLHQEELGDRVAGVVAGFLCWTGVLPEPPRAISAVEQLLKRQMGSPGRAIVAQSTELAPPPPGSVVVARLEPTFAPPVAVMPSTETAAPDVGLPLPPKAQKVAEPSKQGAPMPGKPTAAKRSPGKSAKP